MTMHRSWLIQRLKKPLVGTGLLGADNPFAFGGGLKNGGLSDEAMGLLHGIFRFDYMGAAEFEFGEVPKALRAIAEDTKHLSAFSFVIPFADVAKRWNDKSKAVPTGEATVYVLCDKSHAEEVESRVRGFARDGYSSRLKEGTRLESSLRPIEEWDADVCGWLELDNGFFFFTDREMWERTAALFGVAVPAVTTV